MINKVEVENMLLLNEMYNEEELEKKLDLYKDLEFLSDKQDLGVKNQEMHKDDELCLEEFKKGISYDKINKRYTVALPFNKKKLMLPTSRSPAFSRMRQLQKKFIKDPEYGRFYKEQIDCLEEKKFIEQVTHKTEKGDIIHYLSHRNR